jgi:hypothetical protein
MENIERAKEIVSYAKNMLSEARENYYKNLAKELSELTLDETIGLHNTSSIALMEVGEYLERVGIKLEYYKKFKWAIKKGLNTDFWEKEEFESYIENELSILVYACKTEGLEGLEQTNKILNRIKEIYDKRFKIVTDKKEKNLTLQDRLFLAKIAGFFEIEEINKLNIGKRNLLISKIFNCHKDTVRDFFNAESKGGTSDYYPNDERQKELKGIFEQITK